MTQPRLLVPGATVMITRRTLRRTCLLRPDAQLRQLYTYCLAVTAKRYDIDVHAVVVMSTHEHLVVTDRHGHLPLFLRELHRLVALGVKVLRKWEGAVWDHEPTSVVELLTPRAVVEKLAYVMANPVAAGLVKQAADWPGVRTLADELGRGSMQAKRPSVYFDENSGAWPPHASLDLTVPKSLGMSADELRQAVGVELRAKEQAARADIRGKGWKVAGASRVQRTSPYDRATSWEPIRDRNPTFATGRGERSAFREAVTRLRAFRRAYRRALGAWLEGIRDAVFPYGTWAMQWRHHVAIALPV